MKLNVGDSNAVDVKLTGEATEATQTFFNNDEISSLNGNMEFCNNDKCNRLMLCNTDLCNTYEPLKWKVSKVAHDCRPGQWTNELGGM